MVMVVPESFYTGPAFLEIGFKDDWNFVDFIVF